MQISAAKLKTYFNTNEKRTLRKEARYWGNRDIKIQNMDLIKEFTNKREFVEICQVWSQEKH